MAGTGTGNGISIFSVLDILRRRKLFVIAPTVLLTVGFSLFAWYLPDRYRASALLAAEQTEPPDYLKHVAPRPLHMEDHLWVVRELLFSESVLEQAAREMNAYRTSEGAVPEEALDRLKSAISLSIEGDHTFQIAVDSLDRHEAMNVANKLADLFIVEATAKRRRKNDDAAFVIDEQLEALKRRLDDQSKTLHDYKEQAITALPEHIDANMREVHGLRDQYSHNESKIAEDQAKRTTILKEIDELEAKGVREQSVVEEKSPEQVKLDDLRFEEKRLETRGYTASHPDLRALKRQIREIEQVVAAQPRRSRSEVSPMYMRYVALKSELEGVEQRLNSHSREQERLSGQIAGFSRRIAATPQNERIIEEMRREYQVGQKQLHDLLDKQLAAKLSASLEQSETGIAFAIVEPAGLPSGPYSPQRARMILMGIAAGLGLGLLMVFMLEQNDTTFAGVDDFQAFTTMPVAGVIPKVAGGKADGKSPVVTVSDPDSVAAEQFRILAMRIQQQCAPTGAKRVMITSAAGGEGKSLTAINLALAVAGSTEEKVLLIDADMRKPRVHEYLNITVTQGMGFYRLLVKPEEGLDKHMVKVKNLHVIPGSLLSSNPVAALSSAKARGLFERLKEEFAFIVIDAPPILPIADSHILGGLSDKVLFVVRARETPRELFQHALEGFDPSNVLGAVLNAVDYQRSRYAYAYEYYKKSAA